MQRVWFRFERLNWERLSRGSVICAGAVHRGFALLADLLLLHQGDLHVVLIDEGDLLGLQTHGALVLSLLFEAGLLRGTAGWLLGHHHYLLLLMICRFIHGLLLRESGRLRYHVHVLELHHRRHERLRVVSLSHVGHLPMVAEVCRVRRPLLRAAALRFAAGARLAGLLAAGLALR